MAKNSKKATTSSQKELAIVMVIALLLGAGGGYAFGASSSDTAQSSMPALVATQHGHSSMYMVSADEAPKVELVVSEDAKSGYNIKIIATDFTFTPEDVNGDNVTGEGHAHLYIDGEKIGRLYSPYFHYSGSFEDTKTFRVTLNANDHSEYAIDGEVIATEVNVTHDGSDPAHNESHMTSSESDAKSEDTMHMDDDTHSDM